MSKAVTAGARSAVPTVSLRQNGRPASVGRRRTRPPSVAGFRSESSRRDNGDCRLTAAGQLHRPDGRPAASETAARRSAINRSRWSGSVGDCSKPGSMWR